MAYELNIPLDPVSQTGLSVNALLYSGGSLTRTVSLTEGPTGVYSNIAAISSLASGSYAVSFRDASSSAQYGSGTLLWDGSADATLSTASTFDGITYRSLVELLLAAFVTGKATVINNGDGTSTITRYKQDGTTTKYSVTFKTDGTISASAVLH